jgi:hypothetical protein
VIVGLSGYARSGKNTVGDVLVNRFGYTQKAFADPLRQAVLNLNPIVHEAHGMGAMRVADVVSEFGWDRAKEIYPEVRVLLQRMGTEVGRKLFGEDFWVLAAFKDVCPKAVFTDVRFPNEANAIKLLGGTVWRIERPGYAPVNTHPSETALDDWCFDEVIQNSGNLHQLAEQVVDICERRGIG